MKKVRYHITNYFGGFIIGNSIARLIDGELNFNLILVLLFSVTICVLNLIEGLKED